jgi:hypothetical protein
MLSVTIKDVHIQKLKDYPYLEHEYALKIISGAASSQTADFYIPYKVIPMSHTWN